MINVEDFNELAQMWITAKENEATAQTNRRNIEDRIKILAGIAESLDGTETITQDQFVIKIVGRIDRKVDSEKLQNLAAEHGLTDHLSSLFRWKPDININLWKAADVSITKPLEAAITVRAIRPSFKITQKIKE